MIKRLANAKTELYRQCKELIYDENFPWYFTKRTLAPDLQYDRTKYREISFFTHSLLVRPHSSTGHRYPIQQSEYLEHFERMLMEIFELNQIQIGCFFRVCLNLVYPSGGRQLTIPHKDHFYPHKNVLVYLTDSGGETYCEGDVHDPVEDDVIIFEGEHYHKLPENNARIVLVATYTS
tara:strand:- start:10 stop:543 length:534 start_codon:yes stop_codon:yes gene_type:complete